MSSLRIGIIGAGTIGEAHAKAAAAVGVGVAHVADLSLENATKLAGEHGASASADPTAMLADNTVGAVVIGVPNLFHKQLALDAIAAGKDVLLEKPMALDAAECDEIVAAAERTGRLVQIGFVNRYTPVGRHAKAVVDSGQLGEVYHAKAHMFRRRGVPGLGGWFTTKSVSGGGALIDLGVHLLDLSLFLLGQPKAVSVMGKVYGKFGVKMRDYVYEDMWAGPPNYDGVCDVDDSVHAMIVFDNGSTLDLQCTWAMNLPAGALPDSLVGLFGDRGGLTFQFFDDKIRLASEIAGRNADSTLTLPDADFFQLQMADFAAAVESRARGVGATPAEGREVQAIVDAIYASSEIGESVRL